MPITLLDIYEFYNREVARVGRNYLELAPNEIFEELFDPDYREVLEEGGKSNLKQLVNDDFTEAQLNQIDPNGVLIEALGGTFIRDIKSYIENYRVFRDIWESKLQKDATVRNK